MTDEPFTTLPYHLLKNDLDAAVDAAGTLSTEALVEAANETQELDESQDSDMEHVDLFHPIASDERMFKSDGNPLSLFTDVAEARAMRQAIINGEPYQDLKDCPVCHNRISKHASYIRKSDRVVEFLPCWRRGEWDRYGIHVAPTRVQVDEVWLIP